MLKSAYGLADAPLLWFREASRRLKRLGWKPMELDKCTFAFYSKDETNTLLGMLILHVDDMLIAGKPDGEFQEMLAELKKNFEFGKWEVLQGNDRVTYCGGQMHCDGEKIEMSYEPYLKKICPITIQKGRDMKKPLTDVEKKKCRGLLGALQWPGGQGMPSVCASTSLIAGELAQGTGETIQALNKTLRFAKEAAKHPMVFPKIVENFNDLAVVCFCDAAFGVRQDLSSQGGYVIVLTHRDILKGVKCEFCTVSWRSFKLPRVCRSSLSAESQSMASALEEMLLVKLILKMLFNPNMSVDSAQKNLVMDAAVVTDCKALYDLISRDGIQASLDKRVAIEGLVIKDLLRQLHAQLRWVSSERQIADGMTKLATRQHMADAMKSGYLQLVQDDDYTAAKRKTAEQREASRLATTSRIAMATVAAVMSESLKGTSRADDDDGGFYMMDFVFILTFLIMIAIPMTLGLLHLRTSWTSRTTRVQTADSTAQTDQAGYLTQMIEMDEYIKLQLRYDDLSDARAVLKETVEHQDQVEAETTRLFGNMSLSHDSLSNAVSAPVFHTQYGKSYHRKRDCPHLQVTSGVKTLSACKTCTAANTSPSMSSSRREH